MEMNTHSNYRWIEGKKTLIGMQGCRACKKRCKDCHWPFIVSTATDERNFCSSWCEDEHYKRLGQ